MTREDVEDGVLNRSLKVMKWHQTGESWIFPFVGHGVAGKSFTGPATLSVRIDEKGETCGDFSPIMKGAKKVKI